MKQKKNIFTIRLQIEKKFDPEFLCEYIVFDNGTPIVDARKLLKTQEDELSFFDLLNFLYCWDYSSDFYDTTLYFELEDHVLFGGVYDLRNHQKKTRMKVAAGLPARTFIPYTYTDEIFCKIRKIITAKS